MNEAPQSVNDLDFEPAAAPFPSPNDWRDQVMYQVLIDRFDDNQEHPPYRDDAPRGRDRNESWRAQGGKIKGITKRLDYIKNLGCTSIWITPPFKNRQDDPGSYHGYAIQDYLAIDPRFGTLDDLKELVREAHKRQMYIIVDIVLNHSADIFRYKEEQTPYRKEGQYEFKEWHKISQGKDLTRDDAIWPIELQDPNAFKRKGSIRDIMNADYDEAVNGDFFGLKELNITEHKVIDTLIKCYKYWIAEADIDGFRIDTVRNVEPHAMAIFCEAIHEYTRRIGKSNFIIFGEIPGDDDLLHKYIGKNGRVEEADRGYPLFDAALDFPLYGILDEALKGKKSCADLRERYVSMNHRYREMGQAAKYYVTFVDNHDQAYRPFRRFLNDDRDPRLGIIGMGYLLTNLGIPCIYYGTEQGFDGGGDSDVFVREAMFGGKWGAFDTTGMHFFNDQHPIYKAIAHIAKVRESQPALRYGRQYFREVSANGRDFGKPGEGSCILAYSRVLDTDEVLVVINLEKSPRNEHVLVDRKLSAVGRSLEDLLNTGQSFPVLEAPGGTAMVKLPLDGRQMRILKVAPMMGG